MDVRVTRFLFSFFCRVMVTIKTAFNSHKTKIYEVIKLFLAPHSPIACKEVNYLHSCLCTLMSSWWCDYIVHVKHIKFYRVTVTETKNGSPRSCFFENIIH